MVTTKLCVPGGNPLQESCGETSSPPAPKMRLTCGLASFSPSTKTKQKFAEAGIAFHEVEVTTNRAAFEYITEELGYSQVPVVI
jgi:hypothetical protein